MKSLNVFLNLFSLFTILVFIVIALHILPIKYFDHDEFEHSHAAWCIKEGQVPYKDFIYNHGPILPELNALLWKTFALKDEMATLTFFRYVSFIAMLMLILLTFGLGKIIFNKNIGLCAAMFLISNSVFLLKAVEIRPDLIQNVFWLTGLLLLFANPAKSKIKHLGISLLWGLALLVSLKAILPIATGLTVFALTSKNKDYAPKTILILLGTSVVFGAGLLGLFLNQAMPQYIMNSFTVLAMTHGSYLHNNFSISLLSTLDFIKRNVLFVLFIVWGYFKIFTAQKNPDLAKPSAVIALILFGGLFLGGIYLQWWLTFLPLFAIIAAYGFIELMKQLNNSKQTVLSIIVLLALFSSLVINCFYFLNVQTNVKQIKISNRLLQITKPKDVCLYFWDNPLGVYVFRPHLLYNWHIPHNGIEVQISQVLGRDFFGKYLLQHLANGDCRMIIATDAELSRLPKATLSYIQKQYARVYDGLWLQKKLALLY